MITLPAVRDGNIQPSEHGAYFYSNSQTVAGFHIKFSDIVTAGARYVHAGGSPHVSHSWWQLRRAPPACSGQGPLGMKGTIALSLELTMTSFFQAHSTPWPQGQAEESE